MSYRIQFHISPVHTSTSCLFRFEQPTAYPQKGGAEKQETEAACDKRKDINIKEVPFPAPVILPAQAQVWSPGKLLNSGTLFNQNNKPHYSAAARIPGNNSPKSLPPVKIVSKEKARLLKQDESNIPKLAYLVRTQLQTSSVQASASANGISFIIQQLPHSYCRASAF